MKRALPFIVALVVFALTTGVLFPGLCLKNPNLPAEELSPGSGSDARANWLAALTYEVILDQSLQRFGEIQYFSTYLGGGIPIIGQVEDPVTHPITWLTLSQTPLARLKIKMVLALLAGFLALFYLAKNHLAIGTAGALVAAVFFMLGLRYWPSMLLHPLDTGLLYALPGIAILWAGYRRGPALGVAGAFIALSFLQTGGGLLFVIATVTVICLALLLTRGENSGPWVITRTWIIVLGFAILFASPKLIPVAESLTTWSTLWSHAAPPYVRPDAFSSWAMGGWVVAAKILLLLAAAALWFRQKNGAAGFLVFVFLTAMVLVPGRQATVDEAAWFDSPARYIQPFYLFFTALLFGSAYRRIIETAGESRKRLALSVAVVLFVVASLVGFHFRQIRWEKPANPLDLSQFRRGKMEHQFIQLESKKGKRFAPRDESWHPAVIVPENIGVIDPPFIEAVRFEAKPRLTVDGIPPEIDVYRRYRGEWRSNRRQNEMLKVTETANTITLDVKVEKTGFFQLNRNWDIHWTTNVGNVVPFHRRRLVTVRVEDKSLIGTTQSIKIAYRPFGFYLGLVLASLTALFYLYYTAKSLLFRQKEEKCDPVSNLYPGG